MYDVSSVFYKYSVGAYFLGARASSLSLTSLELPGEECEGVLLYVHV